MSTILMSPDWFFGYDVLFELFFFIISLAIAFYALKVYHATSQKLAQYFGFGFLLVASSYLVQSISNYLVYSKLNAQICIMANVSSVSVVDAIGTYAYMLLMISGFTVLLFVSLKSDKMRTLWILLSVSIIAIMLSKNPLYTFYLLSSIYLAFIAWNFVENYLKNKQAMTLTVALAFIFLWFGTFHFLISVDHELFYVIGHILGLCAYIMILINWYLVRK
ncbi:TPA: hypothetical protein HA235_03915 [Candidatus Woesearchaeota archaeon]|nr:hypothetical protein [uncultured archaeon]MBS3173323.1 hypothetical protein [Candidatus Woesearchaeota archaeon]HIH31829.1 hypothetical protein [Candidatus Woesearchaeota archaeon]HIH55456.1 hypothetical protein [Candidatus Woesearchaeota archaeon]HIJ01902.1 hypothetical protein [Candidatus Woesearchaeota archaeon]